ncbi:MAG TPA: oligopeptide transporter, OPT family [Gemmatimonadales bacterium]|nr:oligopeptide transporter, OPT family [Gemmatimonadales bacterium]
MAAPQPHAQGSGDAPYIPASASLPEITVKALVLGVLLSLILAGANAYLGLFAGMTVSASIPAAVISMAVLRLFRNHNILENNIVQTAAASGEGLAAGAIFTLPALIILGTWGTFDYWTTTVVAGIGGALGVLFTIPLRRALIIEDPLKFPEGIATAEVLKVGESGGAGVSTIVAAAGAGALYKLGATGFKLWGEAITTARYAGSSVAYFAMNLSPALIGVGFIVGLNVAALIFIGGVMNWYIAIPWVASHTAHPDGVAAVDFASGIWKNQTRYIGVGAMIVGGIWALIRVRKSVIRGVQSGMAAYRQTRDGGPVVLRTERDTPMHWVGLALVVLAIPTFFIFNQFTGVWWVAAAMTVIMLVAGFLFSTVAAYMAGLVGSSNNPISGVTIATILTSALLLLAFLGSGSAKGPAAAVFIGAVVACAAAIGGENLQDLKAGRIVGATPYKQQIMQIVGAVSAAFVLAPVLTLIQKAYGIGVPTPDHPHPLAAPQATLMAAVAGGVFHGGLPWTMITIGMAVAVVVISFDLWLQSRKSEFRTPVLAVAIGIYLPLQLSVAIFVGGVIAWLASRYFKRRRASAEAHATGERNGLLFAAGLITGEAMVGILLAIPIVKWKNADVLAFWGEHDGVLPGIILLAVVLYWLYRIATREPAAAKG